MQPARDFAYQQLHVTDQMQWRYELIRPLVLFEEGTAAQRAKETQTHPDTVRTWVRRFNQQGMLGLVPNDIEVVKKVRSLPVSEAVQQETHRLKALYGGFRYRELARILFYRFHEHVDEKTLKQLWLQSPVVAAEQLEFWTYQSYPDRLQARLHVVRLFYQGWNKSSISRFFHVSRPTIDRWIARFEADNLASLMDKKGGPRSPRKVWFHIMVEVYHLQKRHPDAGEFRIWSLLERGLPQTRVLLWVYDEQLRAMFDNVVLAEYRCRYDGKTHQVRDIHGGVFYATPFASPQGLLIPLDPQEAEVIERPARAKRQTIKSLSHKQLALFELVLTA